MRAIESGLAEAVELIEMAEAEGEPELVAEAEATLAALQTESGKRQLGSMLSGEADGNDCYLEVNSGAGGTEANDWCLMLLRMYTRWAERRGFKVELLEGQPHRGARRKK